MTLMMKSCLVSLTILLLWQMADAEETCKCVSADLEQAYCTSDVVISATVTGSQKVQTGNDNSGTSSIQYDIQLNKVYKGTRLNIDAVYTPSSSESCGATLDTGNKLYLITGKLQNDGKVRITRCDFIMLDSDLSIAQKLKLFQCETFGCGC